MWYWVFLWCLFSSLFVHGAVGLLMLVMLQRHRRGRIITVVMVSVGFLASLSGGVVTSKSPSLLDIFSLNQYLSPSHCSPTLFLSLSLSLSFSFFPCLSFSYLSAVTLSHSYCVSAKSQISTTSIEGLESIVFFDNQGQL